MINASLLLTKIKEFAHNDTLYLLEKVSDGSGFFTLNGNILFLVQNTEECVSQNIKTEYLHLESNVHISAFATSVQSFENGFYNYIELFISDSDEQVENIKAFVNICSSYASQPEEIDFTLFFDSLVTLFQLPPEQEYKNLVGLYGELCVIKYFYDNFKLDISSYWHTDGINSKIDIVTPNINIEVKTTTIEQSIYKLKHSQLFENNVETYLAAVSITENNSGISLCELIEDMLDNHDYCNNLSFALNLEVEKRKVSPNEAKSRRFFFRNIKLFNSKEICPFTLVPEIVSDLSYKINLSGMKSEDFQIVVNRF